TGSPVLRHQRAVKRLAIMLDAVCPAEYEVLVAPFAVVLDYDTVMQPDVLVAKVSDLTETKLPAPPVLAVELLSPSTKMIGLNLKSGRFARAGTPPYWTFNPDADPAKARLTVRELVDGGYQQVADVVGSEAFAATVPYPVTVVPADLVR